MKVLHIIPSISPALGGPSQVALNLVGSLREYGIDAEIATTNYDGIKTSMDVPLYQRTDYSFFNNTYENKSVPVWFLPFDPPPLKEFIFSRSLTRWLWQHIQDYDVLDNHYLFSYASTCAAVIAGWKRIPYTVRTMGQLSPWALSQSRLKKKIYTLLAERHNLNRATAIHCTSFAEAQDVRNFAIKTPIVTMPLGVYPPLSLPDARVRLRSQYNIAPETPIILFLSRLHYKKRPDLLLRSLSRLRERGYKCHLILAGSGESKYVVQLQSLAASLEIADQASFAGFVTGLDKDLLLQGSDIFVLPSYSENFGIAVAEALVAGLPVVITPEIQISSDIINARAGLVISGEIESLSSALARLMDCPKLYSELSENAKRLAREKYSWEVIARELASVYKLIVAGETLPDETIFKQ